MSNETSETNDRYSSERDPHGDDASSARADADALGEGIVERGTTFEELCTTQRADTPEESLSTDTLFELLATQAIDSC